jgi:hypothetical protein
MPTKNKAILFGDPTCPIYKMQLKLLKKRFKNNLNKVICRYNTNKNRAPSFIIKRGMVYSPTWLLPNNKLVFGLIKNFKQIGGCSFGKKRIVKRRTIRRRKVVKRRKPVKRKVVRRKVVRRKVVRRKPVKRVIKHVPTCKNGVCQLKRNAFGQCVQDSVVPQVDALVQCGKNFPNGKSFDIPNSWTNTIQNKWGSSDFLNAGTVGRELGPGNTDKIFSNSYFNDIRMGGNPANDLSTALMLNRKCNLDKKANDNLKTPGMIYNSNNPQIVGPGFGKIKSKKCESNKNCKSVKRCKSDKKCKSVKTCKSVKVCSRFGDKLYQQMGPAYAPGYIVGKNTVKDLLGGAQQNEYPRPQKVQNKSIYIGQAEEYDPIKSKLSEFGRKKKCSLSGKTIGEGTTINIKKGKITIT